MERTEDSIDRMTFEKPVAIQSGHKTADPVATVSTGQVETVNDRIRPARFDDLNACFSVQKAADLAAFPHIFPPDRFAFPAEEVMERWRENLSHRDRACWVFDDDDQIVGTAV